MALHVPPELSISSRHRFPPNPNPTPIARMSAAQVSAMRAVAVGIPEWQAAKIRLHRPSAIRIAEAKRAHAEVVAKYPSMDSRFTWGHVDVLVADDLHEEGIIHKDTPVNYVYPAFRQVEVQEAGSAEAVMEYEKKLCRKRNLRARMDAERDKLEPNSTIKRQRISILNRSYYTLVKQYDVRAMLEDEGVIEVGSLDAAGMQMERIELACALENLRLVKRGEMQAILENHPWQS